MFVVHAVFDGSINIYSCNGITYFISLKTIATDQALYKGIKRRWKWKYEKQNQTASLSI